MNAGMKALLNENLKSLKLSTMIRNLQSHLRQAKQDKLSYDEFLLNLTEVEVQVRKENGRKRRLREAKFPLSKPLETFNFEAAPDLDARLIKELSGCEYIEKTRNVIFMGKSGTGKTHLATALAYAACAAGRKVRFYSVTNLVTQLLEKREQRMLERLQKQLEKQHLLVLDELGYVPFTKVGAELLFEVVSRAYERASLIVTTNLPFENWAEVMGNERLTGALLDRLTHRVHILEANGQSYRLKEAKKRRRKR